MVLTMNSFLYIEDYFQASSIAKRQMWKQFSTKHFIPKNKI